MRRMGSLRLKIDLWYMNKLSFLNNFRKDPVEKSSGFGRVFLRHFSSAPAHERSRLLKRRRDQGPALALGQPGLREASPVQGARAPL